MNKPEVKSGLQSPQQGSVKKITREELSKQIRKMRDRDAEMVTGIFKNLENPSSNGGRGSVVFSYKFYPGDANEVYELFDGERYTIPRGVARHLNNNCFYKEHQYLNGEYGQRGIRSGVSSDGRLQANSVQATKKIHRYAFHSLEYMDDDIDMYPSNLVEVTLTP